MFLGLPDLHPDPLVKDTDPEDPYVFGLPDSHPDPLVKDTDPRIRIRKNFTDSQNCFQQSVLSLPEIVIPT